MKVHVLALADIPVQRQTPCCAFTWKAYHLCKMLRMRGHHVILYGCWGSDATVADEFVEVVGEELAASARPGGNWESHQLRSDTQSPVYQEYFRRTRYEVMRRATYRVFEPVCATIGWIEPACRNLQDNQFVIESGIGYKYSFAKFRVFESYSLMHYLWGLQQKGEAIREFPLDVVIPNAFDPDMFDPSMTRKPYALFMGRVNEDKGWKLALDACNRAGITLKVVGQLWPGQEKEVLSEIARRGGEYEPAANVERRKQLMGECYAFFCPTQYCEDFGGVAVEAQLSGAPVITSDWGGFTDTVLHGLTGFRCRSVEDMVNALYQVPAIDRALCRRWAESNFSLERVSYMYDEYLHRVASHVLGRPAPSHPTQDLHWATKWYPGANYNFVSRKGVVLQKPPAPEDTIKRLGFFLQCYRQPAATAFVLENVRRQYPDSPIVLIGDGGEDFSELAQRYACRYTYGRQLGDGKTTRLPTWDRAREYGLRLADAMRQHAAEGCEWTMYLEDDAWIRGPIGVPETDFAGPGWYTWNQSLHPYVAQLRDFLAARSTCVPAAYGGCGGTVYRNARCEPALRALVEDAAAFESLYAEQPALQHGDLLFTCAMCLGGIPYSVPSWAGELDGVSRPEITVIHGWKKHYVTASQLSVPHSQSRGEPHGAP